MINDLAPAPPVDRYLPALNGVRGLAALIVVVSHYSNETNVLGGILGWGGGQLGVMLFFLLAGFLMTHLHIGQAFTREAVGQYAIRRIARVYPYFVLVAALPALLLWLKFPGAVAMGDINTFHVYWRQVLLVDKGSNVFWTIQIEMVFYLCFLGVWALAAYSRSQRFTASVVAVLFVVLAVFGARASWTFFNVAHFFLLGVLSGLFYRRWGARIVLGGLMSLVSLVLLLSLLLAFPGVASALTGAKVDPWKSWPTLAQLLIFFNLALLDKRYLHGFLLSAPLQWLGKVSYSMYLLHYFVLSAIVSWTVPKDHYALNALLVFSVICVVSWVAHRYVELPIQRFTLRVPGLLRDWVKKGAQPKSA